MRFKAVGIGNYRNIESARLDIDCPRVFFCGRNGQGKTNILESLGLVTALRPFRTHENRKVVGSSRDTAELAYSIEHEDFGETELKLLIKRKGKEVWMDGEPIKRVSDFVGRFPTVILSSNDMQIARGSPSVRRRFLDMFLCGVNRSYFNALQTYQRLLQERNALLKSKSPERLMSVFERQLDAPALEIFRVRNEAVANLLELARKYHSELCPEDRSLEIVYRPNVELANEGDYLEALERNRKRDSYLQSTGKGPHRDDIELSLNGLRCDDFASEGQQRSIVLSLALGIIEYWRSNFGFLPVALADDALGELDGVRKERFWNLLDKDLQVISTGTQVPESVSEWKVFQVEEGSFRAAD